MKTFTTVGIFAALTVSSFAFAPSITGSWKGKMSMDMTAIKKKMAAQTAKMPAAQKKQIESQMQMAETMFKTMVIELSVNANGTYSMKNPMAGQRGGKSTETGKWKLTGNSVLFSDDNSKAGQMKNITGKLSKDGKTMVFDLSSVAKAQAAKAGAKASDTPPLMLTFTKS